MVATAEMEQQTENCSQGKTENCNSASSLVFKERQARREFAYFFFSVFAIGVKRVEGRFEYGDHLLEWCDRLQVYARTATIAPRFHLKSTVALGFLAWLLLRMEGIYNEYLFISYREDMAAYHLKRLKRIISALPEVFGGFRSLTDAESILRYGLDGREFICEPEGILAFNRGRHPKGMICDDILRDPQSMAEMGTLEKIKRVFFEELESMPRDFLHVVGTPQDREDLFYELSQKDTYNVKFYPTPISASDKRVLWPECFPFEKLEKIRLTIGDKAFAKEFRCVPVRSTESFITPEKLERIISGGLLNHSVINPYSEITGTAGYCKSGNTVVGGFDIGKKTHPSHLCVLEEREAGRLVQLHSKFMDGWEYKDQIEYLRQAIEVFGMQVLLFDNTRAEFEGFQETGVLPAEMDGVTFSAKEQFRIAAGLDAEITREALALLPDERQKRQLLSVDCDLKAPTTADGHGDAFWSLALAVEAWRQAQGRLVYDIG